MAIHLVCRVFAHQLNQFKTETWQNPLTFWGENGRENFLKASELKTSIRALQVRFLHRPADVSTCRTQAQGDQGKWKLLPSMLADVLWTEFMLFSEYTNPGPELVFLRGG